MKVIVVYDSVSPSKCTKKVAETIAEVLKEKGAEADLFFVGDVDKSTIRNYDFIIAGGPTMAFRPSRGISRFLDDLEGVGLGGKKGAAFDTQMQTAVSGNASKGIAKKLEALGFSVSQPPLVTYVKGKGNNTYELKDGELDKVKVWAAEAARALSA